METSHAGVVHASQIFCSLILACSSVQKAANQLVNGGRASESLLGYHGGDLYFIIV
jgi:hypothetical protein